jgi:hypothetical protein
MHKKHHPIIITVVIIAAIIAISLIIIVFNSSAGPVNPSIINVMGSHPNNSIVASQTNIMTTASINIPEKSNNIYVSLFVSIIILLVIVSVLLLIIRRK